ADTDAHSTQQHEMVPPGLTTADGTVHGNSDHASEPESEKAAAGETAEAGSTPAKGLDNDDGRHSSASDDSRGGVKATEPSGLEYSSSGQPVGGNAQQAAHSHAPASELAQPAKAASHSGGADHEPAFRFDSGAGPSTPASVIEPTKLN